MSRWYRAYDIVEDVRLDDAAASANVTRSVAIATFHALLESAAYKDNCGSYQTTARRIAVTLCEPVSAIACVLTAFEVQGLIQDDNIADWHRYSRHSARLPYQDWVIVRSGVFERDNYTCRYCGAHGVKLECDHVMPVSRGGTNDRSNLVTACKPCNQTKGARTPEEMGWEFMA